MNVNLIKDWPWRSGSSSKKMLKTECIFPFFLPTDFGELHGWHESCVDMKYQVTIPHLNEDNEYETRQLLICRIDEMRHPDDKATLAICENPPEGIWSEWTEPFCPSCGTPTPVMGKIEVKNLNSEGVC